MFYEPGKTPHGLKKDPFKSCVRSCSAESSPPSLERSLTSAIASQLRRAPTSTLSYLHELAQRTQLTPHPPRPRADRLDLNAQQGRLGQSRAVQPVCAPDVLAAVRHVCGQRQGQRRAQGQRRERRAHAGVLLVPRCVFLSLAPLAPFRPDDADEMHCTQRPTTCEKR